MRGRSVRPCSASVPSTTQKAQNTIRSRCMKSIGNANAVANVTMPRMPHQEMRMPP
jgi:hypothetical protein